MKEVFEKDDLMKPPQIGKIIEGKIVNKGHSAVFLDLGPLGTGMIYGKEFQDAKRELKEFKVGDSLFAKIIDLYNEEGYVELSLNQASNELVWTELAEKKEKGETIKIKILGANKGGLLSQVLDVPAFLPVSQLLPNHYPRVENGDATKILTELQKFVGQDLEVKIFDLDSRENKLILSEKAKESEKLKEILKNYKVGDVVDGEITGITDFGVFLKFGAESLEGLIHISELGWQLIENPADVAKVEDKVKAKIISIVDDKVSLSLKALKEDPWIDIETKFKKGEVIEGKVTKFNPFGAFVEVTSKIQGLCHISEFGTQAKMEEKIKIGEKYKFEILSIEPLEHRMSLKLVESSK